MDSILVTKIRSELDAKSAAQEAAWEAFQSAKSDLEAKDALTSDSPEFAELKTLHDSYTALSNEAAELKSRWKDAVSMENHTENVGGEASAAEAKSDGIVTTPEFKGLRDSGLLNSGAKLPSGMLLATAPSPFEKKAALTTYTRTGQGNLNALPALNGSLLGLMNVVPTADNAISYVRQTARSGQAAGVAEGGTKPESSLAIEVVNAPLVNVAVWKKATRQALADEARFTAMIEGALTDDLNRVIEAGIIAGSGSGANMLGITTTAGIGSYEASTTENPADALRQGIAQVEAAGGIANVAVMHPTDLAKLELMKDDNGQYLMGHPAASGPKTIWGLRVVTNPNVAAGFALVGDFANGATLYVKGGVDVHTTDSDGTDFIKNIVTILVEQRALLAVEVPSLFSYVELVHSA